MGPSSFLAPKSSVQQVEQFPVWEILKVLELDQFPVLNGARVISTTDYEDGSRSILIQTESKQGSKLVEKGIQLLQQELPPSTSNFNLTQFEFLFNEKGYLIAVFPARTAMTNDPGWTYFDLTPYYFDLKNSLDTGSKKRWADFSTQWKKDKETIQNFLLQKGCNEEVHSSAECLKWDEKTYHVNHPFVYAEVSKNNQNPNRNFKITEFFPNKFADLNFQEDPTKHQIILPILPTVYSPARYLSVDKKYYQEIYYGVENQFNIQANDRLLLLGPGSGIDTWLASLKTKETIHVAGINPFEVASAQILAQIATVSIVAIQHNNIIDDDWSIIFPEQSFDKFLWNMPAFTNHVKKEDLNYSKIWDYHFHDNDMKRFLTGLFYKLYPAGKALLWTTQGALLCFRSDYRFSVWPNNIKTTTSVLTVKEDLFGASL